MDTQNININNYEAFLLDYYEGNLDENTTKELLDFLDKHPECKTDGDCINFVVPSDSEQLPIEQKLNLKKSRTNYFELLAIKEIEGDLTYEQKEVVSNLHANSNVYKNIKNQYDKTVLTPDKNIKYPHKDELYKHLGNKKQKRTTLLYIATAIAASLLILFTVFYYTPKNSPEIAETDHKTEENVIVNTDNITENIIDISENKTENVIQTTNKRNDVVTQSDKIIENLEPSETDITLANNIVEDVDIATNIDERQIENIQKLEPINIPFVCANDYELAYINFANEAEFYSFFNYAYLAEVAETVEPEESFVQRPTGIRQFVGKLL
ncbi:MAG: hypothetical protein PHP31_09915, partial [Lentimicrobiaceae bacterium]|nr:hypothetical protein [Lentimicrobiaceae bacterium]